MEKSDELRFGLYGIIVIKYKYQKDNKISRSEEGEDGWVDGWMDEEN